MCSDFAIELVAKRDRSERVPSRVVFENRMRNVSLTRFLTGRFRGTFAPIQLYISAAPEPPNRRREDKNMPINLVELHYRGIRIDGEAAEPATNLDFYQGLS